MEKRSAQICEVQRAKGRPSPWPEINHNSPQHLRRSHSPERHPRDVPARSRVPRYSTAINASSPLGSVTRHDVDDRIDSPELCDSTSRNGLSGVNLHTKGTEFYGTSSNFAFLENLYARAYSPGMARLPNAPENGASSLTTAKYPIQDLTLDQNIQATPNPPTETQAERSKSATNKTQLSIVNLLYNPNYRSHSPPQISGKADEGQIRSGPQNSPRNFADENNLTSVIGKLSNEAQVEIEKIFVNSYFSNKHYIHPMLCKNSFMQRCEQQAFIPAKRLAFCRGSSAFSGLYFAVVALGAINASPNETALLGYYCNSLPDSTKRNNVTKPSPLDFADFYFAIAKKALGDIFESCSLESVQALLLLSVFCQNALRPHSCYMYSGMAVRTAVAVGLASGITSLPPTVRQEGIRTWWCIYSHEVEMCCSSGRLDSVKELSYYQVPLPTIQGSYVSFQSSDLDGDGVAMVPVMVSLARIMSEASHLLYHSPKRSTSEMSQTAMKLEGELLKWKSDLPGFLDIDATSLNDPEWAFKQKLVLRLRFYNTRILIHRPFVAASTSSANSPILLQHLHTCLEAAKATIQMQYEAFLHRTYIRTWWYNTTYALYAAMILLHVVLSGYPGIQDEDLLSGVEKSLDIFGSMNNIIVARRCSEMIREVLELARLCASRRRTQSKSTGPTLAPTLNPAIGVQSYDPSANDTRPDATNVPPSGVDGNFFFSLFNLDFQPDTRANMLANLVDPTILENFAFGNGWNDFSFLLDP
ncbi:hypothetical protein ARAM_006333 [Aspergillus rambellii]|uniref:Xylanolytic transcriptional activator regulatory domain-containing protein n=2 Tax=Aspergillus subgen. Nidulantes TaxID=2720870 RepID=A0A0F8UDT6_9EURO|nr:hypothetical protein ARAM_006333 [Aspergillus rambellii]